MIDITKFSNNLTGPFYQANIASEMFSNKRTPSSNPMMKSPLKDYDTTAMNSEAGLNEEQAEIGAFDLPNKTTTRSKLLRNSKKIKKIHWKKEKVDDEALEEDKKSPSSTSRTKKCHWHSAEDSQVLELIAKHGKKWTKIANIIGNRSGKQVRDRYLNYLRPDIITETFKPEEDKKLISLYREHGNKWCKIAAFMPGRTECQVKNRYYSSIRNKMLQFVKPDGTEQTKNSKSEVASLTKESNMELETPTSLSNTEDTRVRQINDEQHRSSDLHSESKQMQPKDFLLEKDPMFSRFNMNMGMGMNMNPGMGMNLNMGAGMGMGSGMGMNMGMNMMNMKCNSMFPNFNQNMMSDMKNDPILVSMNEAQMKMEEHIKHSYEYSKAQALFCVKKRFDLQQKMKRFHDLKKRKEAICFNYFQIVQEMNTLGAEIFQGQNTNSIKSE